MNAFLRAPVAARYPRTGAALQYTGEEFMAKLSSLPLLYQPGTMWDYATPGGVGDYNWNGANGTLFWNDPAERLTVVVGTAGPGEIRKYYREQMGALVYGAMTDSCRAR